MKARLRVTKCKAPAIQEVVEGPNQYQPHGVFKMSVFHFNELNTNRDTSNFCLTASCIKTPFVCAASLL